MHCSFYSQIFWKFCSFIRLNICIVFKGLHEDVNRVTNKPKPITTDIDDNLSDAEKAAEAWRRYLRSEDSLIVDAFVGQLKSTLK